MIKMEHLRNILVYSDRYDLTFFQKIMAYIRIFSIFLYLMVFIFLEVLRNVFTVLKKPVITK